MSTQARLAPRRATPRKVRPYTVIRPVLIVFTCVVFILPFFWMVLSAFKTNLDLADPSRIFNFTPTLENFRNVFETNSYGLYIRNSALVAILSTAASLILGVPAAWAIARFRMERLNAVILLARIVPAILLLVPWYYIFAQIGLIGSPIVLVISHMFVGLPLVTWIMTGFFQSLPSELDEAGMVDGLTEFGTFLRISIPLSVPGIATSSMLAVMFSWNNFLFSLVLADSSTLTLPVALYQFMAYAGIDWAGLMAAATVMSAPIILFYVLAQRYVVSGLTAGATKG